MTSELLSNYELFCKTLYEKMKQVTPVVEKMELYEFRYSLNNIIPEHGGWASVVLDPMKVIEERITSLAFYDSIEIKPKVDGNIVLDKSIENLTNMLLAGLVTGIYSPEWINAHFTFDPRGFNFLVRSTYLTPDIIAHLGGKPFKSFEPKQKAFESCHEVGYREFMTANQEVDELFIESILKLVKIKGTPVLLGIAGPTAAGKTEIVDRLREAFEHTGKKIAAIELDNFLLDRDFREDNNIGSFGKRALHFELLQNCINNAVAGKKIFTPRYDFIYATSSHDLQGNLKPDGKPIEIEPADIIFIEGNSPFLIPEIAPLVGIKVVYLTDDSVRLKRKWRRDIDYRKKYDPYYLRNRFFKEQPAMAIKSYQPQLGVCDIYVNTSSAEIWFTPEIAETITA